MIFGLARPFTVLGTKLDECPRCGRIGEHEVGRRTTWLDILFVPIVLLGWRTGMRCTACGEWTSLEGSTIAEARQTGRLTLDRPRSAATDGLDLAAFDANPRPGAWDRYAKMWPLIAAAVLLAGIVAGATNGAANGGTGAGGTGDWMATPAVEISSVSPVA